MTPTRFKVGGPTFLLVSALLAGGCLGSSFSVARATPDFSSADDSASSVDKAKGSVIQVRSGDKGFILAGSGFFIDEHGTIVTSSTILGENKAARVILNGVEVNAKIVGNDPRSGMALLRVDYAANPELPLGHSTDLKSGNLVMAVGYPMNLPVASTQGPVSGFDSSYLARLSPRNSVSAEERFATTHIHANISISPGEVGGPLLNPRGEVVGMIATSPDDGQSIYALPVEAMQKIIADFSQFGRARHGWVGVKFMQGLDSNHDGRTVRVVEVVPGTPASKSGILPGDTVMRIDSREIYRPGDVLDASFYSQVGGSMNVVVRRDQALLSYSFAVIERPETPAVSSPGSRALQPPAGRRAGLTGLVSK